MAKIHGEKRKAGTYYRLSVTIDGMRVRVGLGYDLDRKALNKLEDHAHRLECLKEFGEKPDARLVSELNKTYSDDLLSKLADLGLLDRPAPKT